jgi:hypothetical protein
VPSVDGDDASPSVHWLALDGSQTLKTFGVLLKRRDYTTAESFWSPKHIQHSAHIATGHAASAWCGVTLGDHVEEGVASGR